ncbi:guanylate cyclase [Trichonephila clavipes]|nr:guanylate cyclase [Trichonephila clavipes]
MDMRQHLVDVALKAAGSLLVIVPTPPQDKGYSDFVENVRQYNFKEPFNFPNKLPFPKHITEFAAYLYDSVILYAEALAQTLAENEDPRNGTLIIQKIINKGMYQRVAAVAEWYRYRIVACLVTSSIPVPLKTRRVGQRCTLNLSRAETSSRWCGVVVRRGGCQLRCRPRHLTMVQNYVVRRQKPSCS